MAEVAKGTATPPAESSQLDTVARLGAQRRKWKEVAKKLTTERETEKAKVTELEKKIAELEKSGGAAKIAELEAKLKETAHRTKFDELAKEAGVKAKALQDLWEKSGYKPEGEAPDETKIKAAIESQRTERDYLFEPAGDNGQQQRTTTNTAAPGRGQGGQARNDGTQFQASPEQLRDPAWCMANQVALQKAAKEVMHLPIKDVTGKFAIV